MGDMIKTLRLSAAGMKAQGNRLRVIAENIANADSVATSPGGTPYQRKVITFKNELDRATGLDMVHVDKVLNDKSPFNKKYQPGHPAADSDGYILTPNVDSLIEMMDMREAQRSYEANLNMIKTSKRMLTEAIDILR
ncbi:MAG: flagellar basal body rod protein FlgC [Rhodospirillales bacterium]|nr:flagellar basal body rod protein FlgC [Rhodospirillales bacterium]